MGKFSLSLSLFFSLWLSHSLGYYLMLAPSDYPHTFSTVLTLSNIAGIYLSAPTCWWWTEPLGYFSWDLWLGTLSVFCCFFSPCLFLHFWGWEELSHYVVITLELKLLRNTVVWLLMSTWFVLWIWIMVNKTSWKVYPKEENPVTSPACGMRLA